MRYVPRLAKPAHQGKLDGTLTKSAYAGDTYKGLKVAEFNIKLTNKQYMNFHNENQKKTLMSQTTWRMT